MTGRPQTSFRCLPITQWPLLDQAAWAEAVRPRRLLGDCFSHAAAWGPATRQMNSKGYGRWIDWLGRTGQLDPEQDPAARATREVAEDYMEALQDAGLADFTVVAALQQLGDTLSAMCPGADLSWISLGSARLRSKAVSCKDLDARMQPVEDILALGVAMMDAADNDRFRTDTERAVLYRDGLLIAFLILRPLRIGNLAMIRIGRHLHLRGDEWWVEFTADEMKGHRPFAVPWPADLTDALARYVDVHREVLLKGAPAAEPMDALWISRNDTAMSTMVVGHRVVHWTAGAFGTAINPHTFRHIVATAIAMADPINAMDGMAVLGHASIETTERYYTRARMFEAAKAYHALIAAERRRSEPAKKRRRGGDGRDLDG
jgi:integrase/recombinase XerD